MKARTVSTKQSNSAPSPVAIIGVILGLGVIRAINRAKLAAMKDSSGPAPEPAPKRHRSSMTIGRCPLLARLLRPGCPTLQPPLPRSPAGLPHPGARSWRPEARDRQAPGAARRPTRRWQGGRAKPAGRWPARGGHPADARVERQHPRGGVTLPLNPVALGALVTRPC